MKFYSIVVPNVIPVQLVTAKATYGIGFLTAFVSGFCSLFGIPNTMFAGKLKKAEVLAMEELEEKAQSLGADGVMDVHCQIDGLSFLVCGTAYKLSPEEKAKYEAEENAKREAAEKAKREAAEKAKREAAEKTEDVVPSGEKCELCDKYFDHLTYCKITDDWGTRYRNICDECMQKHNAKPQK